MRQVGWNQLYLVFPGVLFYVYLSLDAALVSDEPVVLCLPGCQSSSAVANSSVFCCLADMVLCSCPSTAVDQRKIILIHSLFFPFCKRCDAHIKRWELGLQTVFVSVIIQTGLQDILKTSHSLLTHEKYDKASIVLNPWPWTPWPWTGMRWRDTVGPFDTSCGVRL